MALTVLIHRRYFGRGKGKPVISINTNNGRLYLYKSAYSIMKHYNKDHVNFVQILIDNEHPEKFWIKPCLEIDDGSRKLGYPSRPTKGQSDTPGYLSIASLVDVFNLKREGILLVPVEWSQLEQALCVDLTKRENYIDNHFNH